MASSTAEKTIDCITSLAGLCIVPFPRLVDLPCPRPYVPLQVMTRTFHKMHGLGNDFVIFDAREEPLAIDETLARAISDRKTGVGCDQLILLEKSNLADLRMRIWNHDGIEVESCGNASRCVVALTHARTIETGDGLFAGTENRSAVEGT